MLTRRVVLSVLSDRHHLRQRRHTFLTTAIIKKMTTIAVLKEQDLKNGEMYAIFLLSHFTRGIIVTQERG